MKNLRLILLYVLTVTNIFSSDNSIKVTLNNTTSINRNDELVSLCLSKLIEKDNNFDKNSFAIICRGKEIPYQFLNNDKNKDEIIFVVDIKANEKLTLEIVYGKDIPKSSFQTRTYAELARKKGEIYFDGKFHGSEFENVTRYKVPSFHKDHDALFKYEGPGWESELVGYRFYLDWRNATDIFGKKKSGLILKNVGVNDTIAKDDSYHNMQDWGMDIFKVGNSLGIGSFGMWQDDKVFMVSNNDSVICEITKNGPIVSEVTTKYYGWAVGNKKYDLTSCLSIAAGSRLTKSKLSISNNADNIVTGLAKYEGTNFTKSNSDGDWEFISLYGKQSLANDELGIALIYRKSDLIKNVEDSLSYIVKLKPIDGLEYYFCAAWIQESGGIKSENQFIDYLNTILIRLNNPLIVEI